MGVKREIMQQCYFLTFSGTPPATVLHFCHSFALLVHSVECHLISVIFVFHEAYCGRTNKSITKLDLGKNGINRVGALHLLQSLVGNQTMTELNLEWNSLDDEACDLHSSPSQCFYVVAFHVIYNLFHCQVCFTSSTLAIP